MSDESRIEQHLEHLIGALCWAVIGDQHSDVHIGLGNKVRRDKPLGNASLSDEERHWRPELDILIRCAWRLQSAESVRASDLDGGTALKQLVGHTVESVRLTPPGWDLALHFSGGLDLVVFADETREGYQNFSVGVRDAYWIVHAKSIVSWE